MTESRHLTHVDEHGRMTMVDVAGKPLTARRARARARVRTTPEAATLIADAATRKGDVIAACRLAGIMAAKQTAQLVPLAHQVPLSSVEVGVDVDAEAGVVTIEAEARTSAGTGVEIEAMVAASIAAVTCYDMIKASDRSAVVEQVRVVAKEGGSSGVLVLDEATGQLGAP